MYIYVGTSQKLPKKQKFVEGIVNKNITSQKTTFQDIELLFGGFLKLIKKNLEMEVKKEQMKEMVSLKQQLTSLTIQNVKLKQQLAKQDIKIKQAETYLGYSLDTFEEGKNA